MTLRARRIVRSTQIGAAAVAAVLSPVPLADEFVIAPALLGMAAAYGREHGLPVRALPWRALTKTAMTGLVARAAVNLMTSYVPGVAAIVNAITAFALTGTYAEWLDRACTDPSHAQPPSYGDLLRALKRHATR